MTRVKKDQFEIANRSLALFNDKIKAIFACLPLSSMNGL
jgi:hypothetical protein